MSEVTAQEIQLDIDDAKAVIAKRDALERLESNADFKAIVIEGYFKEEAIRLVGLKAHPSMENPEDEKAIIRAIDGIGSFQQHLSVIKMFATNAENAVLAGEKELELMSEEGEL